jgi:anti-sigma factor ChrR (cupin superfamily)
LRLAEIAPVEAHIAACPRCRGDLRSLQPVIDHFASWPTDLLRPTASLQRRLAARIAVETGESPDPLPSPREAQTWSGPGWEQVAPGIECTLLATDTERARVSMLVRLAAGARYPAHIHAGAEELHLLHGELWIDDRKLIAGDYYEAGAGTGDDRVWTETGCTCLLVTSTNDRLTGRNP